MVTRIEIAQEADTWVDVRWRHQGRSRRHGIDCVGLVVVTGTALGMIGDYVDNLQYSREPYHDSLVIPFRKNMIEKPTRERLVGDVVVFSDDIFPCHVGIVTEREGIEHLTHAYTKYRKVVKHMLNDDWDSRMLHCFQFREVA